MLWENRHLLMVLHCISCKNKYMYLTRNLTITGQGKMLYLSVASTSIICWSQRMRRIILLICETLINNDILPWLTLIIVFHSIIKSVFKFKSLFYSSRKQSAIFHSRQSASNNFPWEEYHLGPNISIQYLLRSDHYL